MVSVLSFLFSSIAWLKNVNIPQFWQLLTDTSIEYKSLWVQVPNCQIEKNRKKAFIQLEKIVGFAQYLKTTTGQRILLCSALSHVTMIWFQIEDIYCFARCEEKEKTSLDTISSLHYFNRNKKSTSSLRQRPGTYTLQSLYERPTLGHLRPQT